MRIIFHIDMNSYFASVEQQANPFLRGKPVGVCEHLGGIIIAASVEAKRFGIKTGTPTWEAKKIYPGIILLPVDPPKVRAVTERLLRIFSEYTDLVERYSIDEAFLDVTDLIKGSRPSLCHSELPPRIAPSETDDSESDQRNVDPDFRQDDKGAEVQDDKIDWDSALLLALEIKQRIRCEVGEWLTCSVGIASNKLVAKIASDMEKPDGLTLVRPQDVLELYKKLSLTDIPGINLRTERRLNALGIFSIADLGKFPESKLRANFGIVGHYLYEMGNFRGSIHIITPAEERIKSMGHSYTLPSATQSEKEIKQLLFKLSEKVARRLRQNNMRGSVVSCYARFAQEKDTFLRSRESSRMDFGKSHRIKDFINDGRLIFAEAWRIFQTFKVNLPVRMAEVTVSGLSYNIRREPLFERYKKPDWALCAMDKINDRYGDFVMHRAILAGAEALAGDTVGFGRISHFPFF